MEGDQIPWFYSAPLNVWSFSIVGILPFIFVFCYLQLVYHKPDRLSNGYLVLAHLKNGINFLVVLFYELFAPRWNIYCTTLIITRFKEPFTALTLFSLLFCALSINSLYLAIGRAPGYFEATKTSTILQYLTCLFIVTPCLIVFYVVSVSITNELSMDIKPLLGDNELPILVPDIFNDQKFQRVNCHDVVSPPSDVLVLTTKTFSSPLFHWLLLYLTVFTPVLFAINLLVSTKSTFIGKDNNVICKTSPDFIPYIGGYLLSTFYLYAHTFVLIYVPFLLDLTVSSELYNPLMLILLPVVYVADLAVMVYWTEEFENPIGFAKRLTDKLRSRWNSGSQEIEDTVNDIELQHMDGSDIVENNPLCEVSETGNDNAQSGKTNTIGFYESVLNWVTSTNFLHNLFSNDIGVTEPVVESHQRDEATQTSLIPPRGVNTEKLYYSNCNLNLFIHSIHH